MLAEQLTNLSRESSEAEHLKNTFQSVRNMEKVAVSSVLARVLKQASQHLVNQPLKLQNTQIGLYCFSLGTQNISQG